ncbi:hypothetical protein GS532_22655 [Rhodococcus hoagii]|nr:hypothetical protein [Prescottella equi]
MDSPTSAHLNSASESGLKRGSPLRFALSRSRFPGTTVTLEAGARTFPATVTADSVSWRIETADADLIPDRAVVRIRCIFLDDPTTIEPWLKGCGGA